MKWCRVTRHPLVFRWLTGSQRTPGFRASQSAQLVVFGLLRNEKQYICIYTGIYVYYGGENFYSVKLKKLK